MHKTASSDYGPTILARLHRMRYIVLNIIIKVNLL